MGELADFYRCARSFFLLRLVGFSETIPRGQWYVRGMTAKQEARSLLEKLPDNCSIEDIQYHLYVLEKVRSGLEDARQNGATSQEDAESRLSKWLSE